MGKIIGFVGLGVMGSPMVRKLAGGFPGVRIFDVDGTKVHTLQATLGTGAVVPCGSLEEVGRTCDLIFLSLPNSEIMKKVVLGEGGLASSIKTGGTIIDTSTSDVQVVVETAGALEKKGVEFLDAPVSGGEKAAVEGTLSFMVGGKDWVFKACIDFLKTMGSSVILLGQVGSGQVAKCVNQMIVGAAFASITEAFALGAKNGLKSQTLYNAIKGGWAGSKVLDVVAKDLETREFKPGGTIGLISKDLGYVLSLARNSDFPAPVTALVAEIFRAGKAAGDENRSQTAIIKLWEQVLNLEV